MYVKARAKRSERKMQAQNQFLLCSPFDDEIRKFSTESSLGKLTYSNSPDDTHYIKLLYELMFSTVGLPKRFPEENWFFYLINYNIFKEPRFFMDSRCSWLTLYRHVKRQHSDKAAKNFHVKESSELQQH